jgi:hypothetical protein
VQLGRFEPLTPCMPCGFGLVHSPRSGAGAQPNGHLEVTVTVHSIPLVTAARHPGGTAGEYGHDPQVTATTLSYREGE